MRHSKLSWIIGAALFALLAAPFMGLAHQQGQQNGQRHRHYTLVDLGTLGGPGSNFQAVARMVNNRGTATAVADTPVFDPDLGANDFHAIKWSKGVVTDLGTLPGGPFSISTSINSRGVIAGFAGTGITDPALGFPDFVATLWKSNGQIVNLGTLGGASSLTNAINDQGQVVGGATNTIPDPDGLGAAVGYLPSLTQVHAALWQNGTIQDLGTLDQGTVSFAFFVNARGQVAGLSAADSVPTIAGFFWENGHMVNIGTLGGASIGGTEILGLGLGWLNNQGQIVGTSFLAGDSTWHAFRWGQGHMKDLGTLGGSWSEGFWINDEGDVVGTSNLNGDDFYPYHGFIWRRGVMTDIGTVAGYSCSQAYSINSAGQVVGQSFPCDGSAPSHAFLWENGGPAIDLNMFVPSGSDLRLDEALSINDRGVIVVNGVLPNGDLRAVLLIPGGHDDDSAQSADVATVTAGSSKAPPAWLTPEMLAQVRARVAHRYRGFGPMPPKKSN